MKNNLLLLCLSVWIPALITLLPIIFHLKRESEEKLINMACYLLLMGFPISLVLCIIKVWRNL